MSASVGPADRPRWGRQASLIQPREPAFWLFLAMLAIGGYLFVDEQSFMSKLAGGFALSWLLVILYAIPVALVIYRLDLFEKEPTLLLAAAVVWGGVIATSLAGQANGHWLSVIAKLDPALARDWGPAIVGPGVEETLKLLGVVTIFLIAGAEFDGVLDGFVYGALVGLGFTVVENVGYFMGAAFQAVAADPATANQTQPVLEMAIIRIGGGGLYGHVLFTGLTGMGFAYFVTHRRETFGKRLIVAALGVAAGVGAHVVWNSPLMQGVLATHAGSPGAIQWIEYGALKGGPFLILVTILLTLATRSEEKTFRAIVAGEPDPAIILEPEARSLGSILSRRGARMTVGRQKGPQGRRLAGQLQKAQIDYAIRRSAADSVADPALEPARQRIRWLRAQLAALPDVVPSDAMAVVLQPHSGAQPQPLAQPQATPVVGQAPWIVAPVAVGHPTPVVAHTPPQVWRPTHLVPQGGMLAWAAPDPSRPPIVVLSERLDLVVDATAGDWAHVRAVNGWNGWVDGRLLVSLA